MHMQADRREIPDFTAYDENQFHCSSIQQLHIAFSPTHLILS